MLKKSELHLFIVWNKALDTKNDIYSDIQKNFNCSLGIDMFWDSEMYANNLKRFYLNDGKVITNKVKHIQTGSFYMILVIDENPKYDIRKTTSGVKKVNINIFDLKKKYRGMTGGGHKIHGTDFKKETEHQVFLLLGKKYDDVKKHVMSGKIDKLQPLQNPIWSFQIDTIENMFDVLNQFSKYVVLRNYEGIGENYHDSEHNDIDILIDKEDFLFVKSILNLTEVFDNKYRVHYKTYVNNQIIYFDFRSIGDGYYDSDWQSSILKNRKKSGMFYIPDSENYNFSLLYHALVHKPGLSEDYKLQLKKLFGSDDIKKLFEYLGAFMNDNNYSYKEPIDYSVFFNVADINKYQNQKIQTSLFRFSQKIYRLSSMIYRKIFTIFKSAECIFCSKR